MWENFHKITLSLLVIILALSFFIWPNKWKSLFNSDSEQLNELNIQNEQLRSMNERLENERNILIDKHKSDSTEVERLNIKISEIDDQISLVDNSIDSKKKIIDKMKKDNIVSKKIIDDIKSNPNNKTGDTLILSIKNRLK